MKAKKRKRIGVINGILVLLLSVLSLGIGLATIILYRENVKWMQGMFIAMAIYLVLAIIFLVINWWDALSTNHELEAVRKIAYSDKMTDLENRRAYDEYISLLNERIIAGDIDEHLLVMMMDVNGLKKTNDIFGHIVGDELLIGSAECIIKAFGAYGRCFRAGGDEFIVIAVMEPEIFEKRKNELINNLAKWQGSRINGIEISIGKVNLSEYPGVTMEELIDIADRRMYEDKQHYYASQLSVTEDSKVDVNRLKFADDFSLTKYTMPIIQQMAEVIPGGFFIYREDAKREILYLNRKVLDIYGCETRDEFMELTGGTFQGMVHPEDFDEIQKSIDMQIDDENGDGMDHVIYRIIRKDGAVRTVDDYGHFSHSDDYGDIYYVFINDISIHNCNESAVREI
ncbi:MAG: diguanylate cyclase [Lachnospiraceae bacterium]|nr:diguanylate cyclase [Lachnospiraceae bacterium]